MHGESSNDAVLFAVVRHRSLRSARVSPAILRSIFDEVIFLSADSSGGGSRPRSHPQLSPASSRIQRLKQVLTALMRGPGGRRPPGATCADDSRRGAPLKCGRGRQNTGAPVPDSTRSSGEGSRGSGRRRRWHSGRQDQPGGEPAFRAVTKVMAQPQLDWDRSNVYATRPVFGCASYTVGVSGTAAIRAHAAATVGVDSVPPSTLPLPSPRPPTHCSPARPPAEPVLLAAPPAPATPSAPPLPAAPTGNTDRPHLG